METVVVSDVPEVSMEGTTTEADVDFRDDCSEKTLKMDEDSEMVHVSANGEIEMDLGGLTAKVEEPEEKILEEESKTETQDATTTAETEVVSETTSVAQTSTEEEGKVEKTEENASEEDIILLDDDEDQPGATDSKRPRTDNEDESMQVDEAATGVMSKEEVDMVEKAITKMSRGDLEDLVLAKIVEAIVAHTEVGQLRAKVLELTQQKDRMASKLGVMLKQVSELSSAVNTLMENESRDPKTRSGKPHVIRFNRSVGLQTSIEPSVRSAPPKIIRIADANPNGVKQYGASSGKQQTYGQNGLATQNQATGMKRTYQGGKPLEPNKVIVGNIPAGAMQPNARRVYSASTPPPRIAPKPTSSVTVTAVSQNSQPGIVDLTDDDPPSIQTATTETAVINGQTYQIVNTSAPNVRQLQVQSPNKLIITPTAGQPRPMLLQQMPSNGNQQVVMRGISGQGSVTVLQRPGVVARPTINANLPRVAATIPVRPANNIVLGAASNTQGVRRFVLPPLPVTPTPKVRNDVFRPPPKPELTLNEQADGIVLSWNLPQVTQMAEVTTYQIFACQEPLNAAAQRSSQWKRVGDVKALPLPMACTLSQFTDENRYYFIVRGIDVYNRVGPFCDPQNILLRKKKLN